MAKISSVERNKKRERLVALHKDKRAVLTDIVKSVTASYEDKQAAMVALQRFPRNSAKTRIKIRCQFTGRSRGVYRKFKISRIVFREFAHKGLIPGVVKSSW